MRARILRVASAGDNVRFACMRRAVRAPTTGCDARAACCDVPHEGRSGLHAISFKYKRLLPPRLYGGLADEYCRERSQQVGRSTH
jgi:hypothetical protein